MLAVDRTNQQVADWYVPWHPAILRAIKTVLDAARRHQKNISICGDMAGNSLLIPLLVGMGATALTVPPRLIAQVQQRIKTIDFGTAADLARKVLAAPTLKEIASLLNISTKTKTTYS
jgi:phosphoenolpyruvate-protein kinase (PTS system EI component)